MNPTIAQDRVAPYEFLSTYRGFAVDIRHYLDKNPGDVRRRVVIFLR